MPDDPAVPDADLSSSGAAAAPTPLDPATASLSRALNMSFLLLKCLMAAAALLFLLSCLRTVDNSHVGIVRRFGKILTNADGSVRLFKSDRPFFIWPEPMERLEVVRVGVDNLYLDREFWTSSRRGTAASSPNLPHSGSSLAPAEDGYTLTGDMNIVHSRWRIEYSVDEDHPEDYFDGGAASAAQTPEERHRDRLSILRLAACASVHKVFARLSSDELFGGERTDGEAVGADALDDDVRDLLGPRLLELLESTRESGEEGAPERKRRLTLDEIAELVRAELVGTMMEDAQSGRAGRWRGGIRVRGVYLTALEPPGSVYSIFERVRDALTTASRNIAANRNEAERRVNEAMAQATEIEAAALTHKSQVLAEARAEVERVESFLAAFREDPRGLEAAIEHYKLDRLKSVWSRARVMRVPAAPEGTTHILRLQSPNPPR